MQIPRQGASLILISLAMTACSGETPRLDQAAADSMPANGAALEKPVGVVPDISTWRISIRGLGPLEGGMSATQVRSLIPQLDAPADLATAECTYARSPALPAGAVLMFTRGSLARVDVLSGRIQTDLGARLGDTEDQVEMLYGSSVRKSPHKYTNGHYMTVLGDGADSTFRIVFETDGNRVLRYRAGRVPEVEWVEGCG